MDDFGITLRVIRCARKLSQAELARRAGLVPSYVSRLEAGTRTPDRKTIDALVRVLLPLRSEVVELYQSCGFMPPDTDIVLDPDLLALHRLLSNPALSTDAYSHIKWVLQSTLRIVLPG